MTIPQDATPDRELRTGEAAAYFSVHPKTVNRWADQGRLAFSRTSGGQRRFRESDVLDLLNRQTEARK